VAEKRLFGGIAIDMGFLTVEQLRHALTVQKERRERGDGHTLIGCLLVELGYLTPDQVVTILNAHDEESSGGRCDAAGVGSGAFQLNEA
jgi:hypothetical protein